MLSGRLSVVAVTGDGFVPAHPVYVDSAHVKLPAGEGWVVAERDCTNPLVSAVAGCSGNANALRQLVHTWPLQAVWIEHTGNRIALERNHNATCPLYALYKAGTLCLEWDPTRLYPLLEGTDLLDRAQCAAFLEGRFSYGSETVFRAIRKVPERAVLSVSIAHGLEIRQPVALAVPVPQPLAKNADPVAMLHQLLQQALRRLAPEAGRVCAELSSGLDSTLVALNVTEHLRSPIVTLGHAVVSQDSEAIAPRRQEAVARLGARDFCIWQEGLDEEAFPAPGRRFWPYHSLELTDMALVRQAASIGANIVFSGIGGDEMCALQEEERGAEAVARCFGRVVERSTGFLSLLPDGVKQENVPFWPPGLVPQSANDAPNWNAVRYLRRGLWPAHPLALATVQTFAHFLKPEWRRERYLSRDLLRRHGMSEAFLQQKPEEDLSPVYRKVMADERIFDLFFRDSILAAEGLLDMGKVRAAQETLRQNPHGKNDRASFPLTMAVLLERSLRSLAEPA